MPFGIGIWELLILLLVLLLVFGPKRLPEMGRQLGKGMREFKDSVSGKDKTTTEVDDVAELPPADPVPDATPRPRASGTPSPSTDARGCSAGSSRGASATTKRRPSSST